MHDLPGLGVHAEGAQGVRQAFGVVAQLRAHLRVVAAPVLLQQGDGRVAVRPLTLGQFLLDGAADLLGRRLHLLLQLGLLLLVAEGLFGRGRLLRRGRRGRRRRRLRLAADGLGRRCGTAPQHLVRRAHVVAPPPEERAAGGHGHRVLPLAVQGDVDIGPLPAPGRRLFGRGGLLRRCGGKVPRQVLVVKVVVLVPAQALAIAAHPLRRLLGRQVQGAQQRRQQQHREHDDGHHLAHQGLAAQGQPSGQDAAALQALPVGPQGLDPAAAEVIGRAAQRQMAQHAHQQRQHRHADGPQDHRAALMPQLDHRHGGQGRGCQIVAVAQRAPQHPGDPGQQQCVHIKIAHQHAQRQQGADDAAHQPRRGVIRRGRGRRRGLFARGALLLCRCHSLPHLMPCRTRVSTPTAQQ